MEAEKTITVLEWVQLTVSQIPVVAERLLHRKLFGNRPKQGDPEALAVHRLDNAHQPENQPEQRNNPERVGEGSGAEEQRQKRYRSKNDVDHESGNRQQNRLPRVKANVVAVLVRREEKKDDGRNEREVRDCAGCVVRNTATCRYSHYKSFPATRNIDSKFFLTRHHNGLVRQTQSAPASAGLVMQQD